MRLTDLVPILQMAIGPTILISGVGLLLLSMTNRLGRIIDRSRLLAEALRKGEANEHARLASQLEILSRRAGLIRVAIILATLSVLLAGVLIIALFLAALFNLEMGALVIGYTAIGESSSFLARRRSRQMLRGRRTGWGRRLSLASRTRTRIITACPATNLRSFYSMAF